ncbi:MAG: hypothetical protein PHC91_04940 [Eubacteriales bacterium]|nr:hypothetical protein [Eubacteriales bacterium]
MLERIDIKDILSSFVIGALIGLFAQMALNPVPDLKSLVICVLISGIIGFFVGTAIVYVMALLPIQIAKPSTYFIINNLAALFITLAVILSFYFYGIENFAFNDLRIVLFIAFVVIVSANILDYFRYRRTNLKLMEYIEKKNKLK